MMARWWLVEHQQIFTNITHWLTDWLTDWLYTYQGTFRNTYGLNNFDKIKFNFEGPSTPRLAEHPPSSRGFSPRLLTKLLRSQQILWIGKILFTYLGKILLVFRTNWSLVLQCSLASWSKILLLTSIQTIQTTGLHSKYILFIWARCKKYEEDDYKMLKLVQDL